MKKILVVGHKGKMGSVVFEELSKNGFAVVGKDKEDEFSRPEDTYLVIDFGGAESSALSADWCRKNKIPLIVGSTGQNELQMKFIEDASKVVPVVVAGNFSLGILCMKKMLEEMSYLDIEDVCIFEKHHKNKKDSPSGTSLEIEKVVRERLGTSPQMLSLRGGCEVGTHSVSLYFGDECIEISHKAFSRKSFAKGVILVVGLIDKLTDSGLYSFEDVMQKI